MKKSTKWVVLILILLLNAASGVYIYQRMREGKKPVPAAPPKQAAVQPSEPVPAPEAAVEPVPPPVTAEPAPEPTGVEGVPLAVLVGGANEVKVRISGSEEWQAAQLKMPLYQNDAVRTYENATAQIAFGEQGSLEVGQNTLLIIKPLRREALGKEIAVAPVPGEIADRIASAPPAERAGALEAEAAKRQVTIRPVPGQGKTAGKTRAMVRALPDQSTSVEAVTGTLEVARPQGAGVTVKEKMVTRVDDKGALAAPRLPLTSPALLSPKDGAAYAFQSKIPRVEMTWKQVERATDYRILVASDASFKSIFADEKVKGTSLTLTNLPPGTYYWRVSARDSEGFTGAYSASRSLKAVYDDSPPQLSILSPRDMFVSPTPAVDLKGKTESAVRVKVNGEKVSVAQDGSFTHTLTLKEGVNMVTIEAIDPAGNLAYGRRVLTYRGGKRSPLAPAGSKP